MGWKALHKKEIVWAGKPIVFGLDSPRRTKLKTTLGWTAFKTQKLEFFSCSQEHMSICLQRPGPSTLQHPEHPEQ